MTIKVQARRMFWSFFVGVNRLYSNVVSDIDLGSLCISRDRACHMSIYESKVEIRECSFQQGDSLTSSFLDHDDAFPGSDEMSCEQYLKLVKILCQDRILP